MTLNAWLGRRKEKIDEPPFSQKHMFSFTKPVILTRSISVYLSELDVDAA